MSFNEQNGKEQQNRKNQQNGQQKQKSNQSTDKPEYQPDSYEF